MKRNGHTNIVYFSMEDAYYSKSLCIMQGGVNHHPFVSNVRKAWCCNVCQREKDMTAPVS